MKLKRQITNLGNRHGSAVLVVLVLLFAITIIVVENNRTLLILKQELKLIDQRQQKQHGQTAGH